MNKMFYNCKSLLSLNINNFSISPGTTMDNIFYSCNNLILLNFSNFNKIYNTNLTQEMINGINPNLIYCLQINLDISNNFEYNCSGFAKVIFLVMNIIIHVINHAQKKLMFYQILIIYDKI